jgi:predicted nucleic acid-binding protein
MNILVPDASVILKWLLPAHEEEDMEKALQIRDAYIREECLLHVPTLWFYEIGNTLSRRFPEHAGPLLEAILELDLEEHQIQGHTLEITLDLIERFGVTFYDAAYHVVAINEAGTLITADRKYYSKARAAEHIVCLQDWSLS